MALARYVVTARVTLTPDTAATAAAGGRDRCTGRSWQYRHSLARHQREVRLAAPDPPAGQVVYADSSTGSTRPQLLYQAIGSTNLRAYTDQDQVGHAAISNLLL